MKSKIVDTPIGDIDANPFRMLGQYPYVERKLEALQRSYKDVGMWEGVIAREVGNRAQIAFGHHRVEAGRLAGMASIPLIIKSLTDEEMLKYLGRENGEDYNADFLCMLETWEAAVGFSGIPDYVPKFLAHDRAQNLEAIEIARLLGWTRPDRDSRDRMNATASACNAAYELITGGYIHRDDLKDMTVSQAREIVERAQSRMEQVDKVGKTTQRDAREIEQAKTQIGRAVKETARQSRDGRVAQKDLRGRVDVNAYRFAQGSKKQSPLFEQFGKNLADGIERMLNGDTTSQKLDEVVKAVSASMMDEDKQVVTRLQFELGQLGERAATYQKRLVSGEQKIVHLQIANKGSN